MSPTNLGDLLSNQPVPTGLVQHKRGAYNAGLGCPANAVMTDGQGAPMQIAITPARAGWWVIRADNIFIMVDAAWYYFNWFVRLNVADANGIQDEYAYNRAHSAIGWQLGCIDTVFKLNAGQAYTATMYFGGRQAGTINYFTGLEYCQIAGEFIAEGSI